MIFMAILLISLVAVVGVAMFVAREVDYGEARFDSDSGKVKSSEANKPTGPAEPANRKEKS